MARFPAATGAVEPDASGATPGVLLTELIVSCLLLIVDRDATEPCQEKPRWSLNNGGLRHLSAPPRRTPRPHLPPWITAEETLVRLSWGRAGS